MKNTVAARATAVAPRACGAAPTVACHPEEGVDTAVVAGESPRCAGCCTSSSVTGGVRGGAGLPLAFGAAAAALGARRPRGLGLRTGLRALPPAGSDARRVAGGIAAGCADGGQSPHSHATWHSQEPCGLSRTQLPLEGHA